MDAAGAAANRLWMLGDPGLYGGRPNVSTVMRSSFARRRGRASCSRPTPRRCAGRREPVQPVGLRGPGVEPFELLRGASPSRSSGAGHLARPGGLPAPRRGQAHRAGERVTLTSGAEEGARDTGAGTARDTTRRRALGTGGRGVLLAAPARARRARATLGPGRLGEPAAARSPPRSGAPAAAWPAVRHRALMPTPPARAAPPSCAGRVGDVARCPAAGTPSIASASARAAVDQRVGAGHVGADLDQVLGVAAGGQQLAQRGGVRTLLGGGDGGTTREIDSSTSMLGKWPGVASRRSSTTWPSRIERAASAIGSLWSSPSTSTV